jgi:hypothetical protein
MSKKLIAIASAAALALAALVAVPAGADAGDIDVQSDSASLSGGTSAKTAFPVNVPVDNEFTDSSDDDYLTVDVSPVVSGGTITATSSGSVKLLSSEAFADADAPANSKTGKSSVSEKAVLLEDVTFYVYSTSTTAGTVTIRNGDNVKVIYVKGTAGEAHTLTAKFPTSLNSSTASKIDATVKDVFGNVLSGSAGELFGDVASTLTAGRSLSVAAIGAATEVSDAFTWSTSRKVWVGEVIGTEGGGQASITVTLDDPETDYETAELADPKLVAFSTANAADLATQIATLTAKLANTVSKAKYNNLVKKYNKITRGKKAKLVN